MLSVVVLNALDVNAISFSMNSQVYRIEDDRDASKNSSSRREFELMVEAGDCSVKPIGRSLRKSKRWVYKDSWNYHGP